MLLYKSLLQLNNNFEILPAISYVQQNPRNDITLVPSRYLDPTTPNFAQPSNIKKYYFFRKVKLENFPIRLALATSRPAFHLKEISSFRASVLR